MSTLSIELQSPVVPRLRETLANCLLWVPGSYATPEDAADGVMKRLAHDGYLVLDVSKMSEFDLHMLLDMRRRAGDAP